MYKILFLVLLMFSISLAHTSDLDQVHRDLKTFDEYISEQRSEFNKAPTKSNQVESVKSKLEFMVKLDQYTRKYINLPQKTNYSNKEKEYFFKKIGQKFNDIDKQNTAELKKLIEEHGWFVISKYGIQADQNAWLLVQHADLDQKFQKEVLLMLSKLWKTGETNPANYAYLYDRVNLSYNNPEKIKLQRYGTQGRCIGKGLWQPHKMEDPSEVNSRRKQMGLPSIEEYIEGFKAVCL